MALLTPRLRAGGVVSSLFRLAVVVAFPAMMERDHADREASGGSGDSQHVRSTLALTSIRAERKD